MLYIFKLYKQPNYTVCTVFFQFSVYLPFSLFNALLSYFSFSVTLGMSLTLSYSLSPSLTLSRKLSLSPSLFLSLSHKVSLSLSFILSHSLSLSLSLFHSISLFARSKPRVQLQEMIKPNHLQIMKMCIHPKVYFPPSHSNVKPCWQNLFAPWYLYWL